MRLGQQQYFRQLDYQLYMADRKQRNNGYIHETETQTRIQTDSNIADTLMLCRGPVLDLIRAGGGGGGEAHAKEGKLGKERSPVF